MRASATICAGLEAVARDREVLDGALRLRAVERRCGHPHLAHRVVLDAVLGGVVHVGVFPSVACRVRAGECRDAAVRSADDDVGYSRAPFGEAVVRADDSQRTRGDRVADQLGALRAARRRCRAGARARRARRRRRRAPIDAPSPPATRRTAGTIGAISVAMCGGSGGGVGRLRVDRGAHRTALVVAEHEDERHAEHADRVLEASRAPSRR